MQQYGIFRMKMATDVCNDLAGMNCEAIFGIFMMAAIQSGIPVPR